MSHNPESTDAADSGEPIPASRPPPSKAIGTQCCVGRRRSQASGPMPLTLDDVDLLPPLLAGGYIAGQQVWTREDVTYVQESKMLPMGTAGRILRSHDEVLGLLWVFARGEVNSIAADRLTAEDPN